MDSSESTFLSEVPEPNKKKEKSNPNYRPFSNEEKIMSGLWSLKSDLQIHHMRQCYHMSSRRSHAEAVLRASKKKSKKIFSKRLHHVNWMLSLSWGILEVRVRYHTNDLYPQENKNCIEEKKRNFFWEVNLTLGFFGVSFLTMDKKWILTAAKLFLRFECCSHLQQKFPEILKEHTNVVIKKSYKVFYEPKHIPRWF